MNRREFLRNAMISGAAVVAIAKAPLPALGSTSKQTPPAAVGMNMDTKRITHGERAAAAARAKALREAAGYTTNALYPNPWLPSSQPDYFGTFSNYANSQLPEFDPLTGAIIPGTGIRKFVDSLPGLTPAGANNLGNYIPVAAADTTTYSGSDYYVIALVQYAQKMHSDLPPTLLRGYVQVKTAAQAAAPTNVPLVNVNRDGTTTPVMYGGVQLTAVDKPSYLGPLIVATKNRPARFKFINALPTGSGGDLFIPTDTTYMGAGMGPGGQVTGIELTNHGTGYTSAPTVTIAQPNGQNGVRATAKAILYKGTKPSLIGTIFAIQITNPGSGYTSKPNVTLSGGGGSGAVASASFSSAPGIYTQNRATIHLHGGLTPWISDGTPHQWITPPNETTPYPKGVSVFNVPDMDDPGPGAQTFYYSNQQSARLMFYHDHAYGLTRVNVYAGEAAGYLLTDSFEASLVSGGAMPSDQIPLIIQDKSFVPKPAQLAATDPTWDSVKYGGQGSLWFPHVYMPNQNPADVTGANAVGRWDYGPWFWPPLTSVSAIPNAYFDPAQPWEPPQAPGTPFNSGTPESFMDTPVINGCAYPYLNVQPKAYRFRILNASNDRFFNLQLYQAASQRPMWDAVSGLLLDGDNGEVPMVTALATPGFPVGQPANDPFFPNDVEPVWPTDNRAGGVPDPNFRGPNIIQYGSEGGILPAPVVLRNQPIDYVYDRRNIVVLNVGSKNLFMAPAERADVIIDFSQFAGKTIILYNDSPAPVPAADPRIDYYTGKSNHSAIPAPNAYDLVGGDGTGGAVDTKPGYGPNTRTIMQFRVAPAAVGGSALSSVTLVNGGQDYTSMPNVEIVSASGSGATLSLTGSVEGFTVSAAGLNYSANPTVTIAAPVTGVTATAKATVKNGRITGVTVINGGSGYTTSPAVTITDGSGSGAAASSTLSVSAISVTTAGSGYLTAPDLFFSGGGGYGAGAIANLANTGTPAFSPLNLLQAFTPGSMVNGIYTPSGTTPGIFVASQDPIIVPQLEYSAAYGKSATPFSANQLVPIQATQFTFTTLEGAVVNRALGPKCIQELFTLDYGRMNATLGVEVPNTNFLVQTTIPYGYIDPPTEVINSTPTSVAVGALADGTQIWKITHNGVDTHVIHFHIVNVQVINRVGWDGAIRNPDPNELGWKESVRMNPLEDCIVALRPVTPTLAWEVPNSYRLMDVTKPIGSTADFSGVAPNNNPVAVANQVVNFGWEYVWHCHILGHEENDMMRPIIAAVPPTVTGLTGTPAASPLKQVVLRWPASLTSTGWTIQKKLSTSAVWTNLVSNLPATTLTYTDSQASLQWGATYNYRLVGSNTVGPNIAPFPTATVTATSNPINVLLPPTPPATVSASQAAAGAPVIVTWTASDTSATFYRIVKRINGGSSVLVAEIAATNLTYSDSTNTVGQTVQYAVAARNPTGYSSFTTQTNPASFVVK